MNMPGIEFLRDRKGRRKAVLIDLKKHKRLWEDLYDAYLAHNRRGERRESLATVKRVVKLEGASDLWRIRVGEWRVVYRISDRDHLIDIVTVRHRRDAYR